MPTLLDKVAYFADERLSENIDVTPEGYLICRNAVIGRTGFQTYKFSEIADPEGLLAQENIQRNPDDKIDLWRDIKEVFSPATIASFEGKTFTFTHPDQLLDPDTERYHHAGHVQNVRRGEPLDSGDIPLLADIIVTDRGAIDAIRGGDRELSCGYTYKLVKRGNRWDQASILGNHVALVQKGRAGTEARIYDADPEPATSAPPSAGHPAPTFPADHVPAIRVPKGGSSCATCKFVSLDLLHCASADYVKWNNGSPDLLWPADEFCSDWYVPKAGAVHDTATDGGWKEKTVNIFQKVFGLGLQAYAKDAKPEELAAALSDPEMTAARGADKSVATDKKDEDKSMVITLQHKNGNGNGKRRLQSIGFTKDGVEIFKALDAGEGSHNAAVPGVSELTISPSGNDEGEEPAKAAMDRRKRMHDMIDNLLNQSEAVGAQRKKETDADVGELKKLMSEYLGEEAGETQHADADPDLDDELPENFKKGKDEEEEEKKTADDDDDDDDHGKDEEEEEKSKDADIVRAEPELEENQTPKDPVGDRRATGDRVVFDAAATMVLLKAFRPIVAGSKDKRVRSAFDTLYQGLRRAAKKGSTGRDSYARVIKASGKVAADKVQSAHDSANGKRPKESPIQQQVREADEMYATHMKKNRGMSATILEKARNKS